jgi:predicted RNase H-like HicB family nuclease/predicted RNA binding protein YcfA (HicA-like mRNA interferase family)
MKIRDVLRLLAEDEWYLARTRGSHQQFKHAAKPGVVTVAGHPSDELAPGHAEQHPQASGTHAMKLLIVVEQTGTGYSAYSPDLPGCVAAGPSRTVVEERMREAIELHVEGLRADGVEPPEPHSYATVVDFAA